MSKSRGNTVSPDQLIEEMGADTERVYTLFLGPPEDEVEWNDEAVAGRLPLPQPAVAGGAERRRTRRPRRRPTRRSSGCATRPSSASAATSSGFKFNTAIAALMELVNGLTRALEEKTASKIVCEQALETLLQLLHPMAPHITEELWERARPRARACSTASGRSTTSASSRTARIELVVQVDGKLRDRVEVEAAAGEAEVREAALESRRVREHLQGRELAKAVVVPGRLINLVTRKAG